MGIPISYRHWIHTWLMHRRAYIEIEGKKSRWFNIHKGCPQGCILSPTLFIAYHADMGDYLGGCLSHFFADDLAAIVAGGIGIRYSDQCLELEKKLNVFFRNLEAYSSLNCQPINYSKTEGLWTARAIGSPRFGIYAGETKINWVKKSKYLGYWITRKLGFSCCIEQCTLKIRQRMGLINSVRISSQTSLTLRKTLFQSYVLPIFTWMLPLFPLFTKKQQVDLNHFYYTCLKRIYFCLQWEDSLFAFVSMEISLEDRCKKYWEKYFESLAENEDGRLLCQEANLNLLREAWRSKDLVVSEVYRSKRFVRNSSVLERILMWCSDVPFSDSIPNFSSDHILTLAMFPETF